MQGMKLNQKNTAPRKYSDESCGGMGKLLSVPPSRPAPTTGSGLTGEHLLVAELIRKLRRSRVARLPLPRAARRELPASLSPFLADVGDSPLASDVYYTTYTCRLVLSLQAQSFVGQ